MKKMDEMEVDINLKAIKWAWLYTTIFLAIWMFYEVIYTGKIGLAALLLLSQNIIYFGTQIFLKWKLGKDEK